MFLLFDEYKLLYCLTEIVTGTYVSIFLDKKKYLCTLFQIIDIFQEWALFLIFYIQSFTVTEYLNVKEDTGFFLGKAWES